MPKKIRADQLLHDCGLAESREQAKRLIMAGQVLLETGHGNEIVSKPGQQLAPDAPLSLKAPPRFVSRGGEKLLTAMEAFGLDLTGAKCLDAGASTGGFTDCMLQHGAAKVYAVDVGHGQLHEKLVADARVVNLDRINLRHAAPDLIPEPVDFASVDVSFISLTQILPVCQQFIKPGGTIVALIKPQFELGPGRTIKGIVKKEEDRQEAIHNVSTFATDTLGLTLHGVVPSKILGPKGNQEYLAHFTLRE